MANCNKLFLDFNKELNISSSKRDRLIKSKNDLRDRVTKYMHENHDDFTVSYFLQGSYKMGTMIKTKDNECDFDDGIYLDKKPDETAQTVQGWIKEAVKDATTTHPQHKKKCIRVIYQGDYHIDLPVYFERDYDAHPSLADKDDGWDFSDPREFFEWFKEQKDDDGQLVKIIRYLKAWGDYKRNKMPNGLTMSVLAANNIVYNDRDDIALKDTLQEIQNKIQYNFHCYMPTTPYDDLLAKLDNTQKDNFLDRLTDFISDAKKAVEDEKNQLTASKLWKKHLSDRFPEGEDEDVDVKEQALRKRASAVLSSTAFTGKEGRISDRTDGVKNTEHRNYGE